MASRRMAFITSGASASAWHLSPMKARQLLRRSWQAVPSNLRQRHCQTREDDLRAEVADDRQDIFHQGHEHMPARWVVVADLDYFHWALLIAGNFLREVVLHRDAVEAAGSEHRHAGDCGLAGLTRRIKLCYLGGAGEHPGAICGWL